MKKFLRIIFTILIILQINILVEGVDKTKCDSLSEKKECLEYKWNKNLELLKSDTIELTGNGKSLFPIIDTFIDKIGDDKIKLQILEERISIKRKEDSNSYITLVLRYMALRVDFYQEMVLLESSFDIDKELLENNQDAFEILLEYSSLNELEILFKKIYDSDSLYKQGLEKFLYRENLYNNSETYIVPDSIDAMSRDERKRFYTQMIQKEYLLRNRTSVNQEYFIETVGFLDDSELEGFYYSFFSTEKEAHMAILSYSKELFGVDGTNISPNLTLGSIIDIIGVDQYGKESILHVTLITNIFEKK